MLKIGMNQRGVLFNFLFLVCMQYVAAATPASQIETLIEQGKLQEALNLADRELTLDNGNFNYLFLKGLILTKQNKLDKAAEIYLQLSEAYPELPEPLNNLAVIYAAKGDYVKARQALQQAINTHPAYATAHENLGDIYAKLASNAYNQALQLDDGNDAAREKLSMVEELFSAKSAGIMKNDSTHVENEIARAELSRLEQELRDATEQTRKEQAKAEKVRAELIRLEQDAATATERAKLEQGRVVELNRTEQEKLEKARTELAELEQRHRQTLAQVENMQQQVTDAEAELRALEQSKIALSSRIQQPEPTPQPVTPPPAPPATSPGQERQVLAALDEWAQSWSGQNIEAYISCYAADFNPGGGVARADWVKQRKVRLSKPGFIKIDVLAPKVSFMGDQHAYVKFRQEYQSDTYADSVSKTILFRHENNRWLIVEENTDS